MIQRPGRGGAKKHEIYGAAFGGHLFYDLFLQGWGGAWPPRHPPIRYCLLVPFSSLPISFLQIKPKFCQSNQYISCLHCFHLFLHWKVRSDLTTTSFAAYEENDPQNHIGCYTCPHITIPCFCFDVHNCAQIHYLVIKQTMRRECFAQSFPKIAPGEF